jgi:filamentous hemagglutinin
VNQGTSQETLVLPSFTGPKTPTFTAPGGLSVQIAEGDFKSQIITLGAQPGMGYLNDLAARKDVNWQPVKLAFEQWNYKQEGLTPAGAALLAAAVAWALPPGVGANLIGVKAGTTSALMANAAFTSLAAQASITFVNNKGDIGKTLKELASSQTVKATIAAALTAGVLDKLGATSTMKDLSSKTGFSEKLTYNLINATGRALTNTAINGGNLEDALKQALIGGLVDTAHGQAASKIGQADFDYVSHKLAHALAGCVAGSAAGGTCKDGAIGGAVGEIVAEMFKSKVPAWTASDAEWAAFDKQVKDYGKIVAGAVSAYAGGNAQTAITTAEVAIDNNSRIAFRIQAMQQSVSPQQFWINSRVQSLQTAVRESGGSPTGSVTTPGARVNYSQNDITQLEAQLRGLSPNHQLIYSQSNSNVSPMPASYVNMRTAVNMDNVVGASGTNAFGFPSGSNAYFRELMRQNPQMFSADNQARVNVQRVAPVVDAQWIQYNPTHQSFSGETLVHHHWMQGNIAVAIPTSVHQQWYRTFHPYR